MAKSGFGKLVSRGIKLKEVWQGILANMELREWGLDREQHFKQNILDFKCIPLTKPLTTFLHCEIMSDQWRKNIQYNDYQMK